MLNPHTIVTRLVPVAKIVVLPFLPLILLAIVCFAVAASCLDDVISGFNAEHRLK